MGQADTVKASIPEIPDHVSLGDYHKSSQRIKDRTDQLRCKKFIIADVTKDSCILQARMELESGATSTEGVDVPASG